MDKERFAPTEVAASPQLRDRTEIPERFKWNLAHIFPDWDAWKEAEAGAWFDPELLSIPLSTVQEWMASSPKLALYRFAIEDLYRQQEHVLDDKGERLLSLSSRFSSTPYDAYAALSTADLKHPSIVLPSGAEATLTYGQYRAILATNPNQADRAAAFHEFHKVYDATVNTYAALYNGVLQRDWFHAQ